jgi:transglutaminase-like putative cysteine protease
MSAATSIAVDMNLGDASSVSALTLEAVGMGNFTPPVSHRQKVRRENGHVFLDLYSDFRAEEAVQLSDADRKKFTSATATIQSDAPKVRKLAAEIVGETDDPLRKAERLKSWVYQSLRKTGACNSNTTLGVLDNMAGDCTEHTLLFVSLARAVGLPARELTGVAYADNSFGWHAWAEVYNGRQWVGIDPTWNELFIDATHIVFSVDSDNQSWMNVLGKLSFRTMKVEHKGQ